MTDDRAARFDRFRRCRNGCGIDAVAVRETMSNGLVRPALQCPECLRISAYVPLRLMRRDVESLPPKMMPPNSRQQSLFQQIELND